MLPPNPSMSFFDNTLADNLGKVMHSEAEAMAVVAALGAPLKISDFPSVSEQLSAIFPCSPESTQRRLELKAKHFLPGRQNFFIRSSKFFRKPLNYIGLEANFFLRFWRKKPHESRYALIFAFRNPTNGPWILHSEQKSERDQKR